LKLIVPTDCIATHTAARDRRAVLHFDQVLQIATTLSTRIRMASQ
jgi:hypothetical protein